MRKIIMSMFTTCMLSGFQLPNLETPTLAVRPTAYHTVSFYDVHGMERDQANAWCHDDPGLAEKVPSCANADISGIHAWNRKMGLN
jgi:hypothetical protein